MGYYLSAPKSPKGELKELLHMGKNIFKSLIGDLGAEEALWRRGFGILDTGRRILGKPDARANSAGSDCLL